MPAYFVMQPDGRFARFSTVVDDFTDLNMSEEECIQLVVEDAIARAKKEATTSITSAKTHPEKWAGCLLTVENIHGKDLAIAREEQSQQ